MFCELAITSNFAFLQGASHLEEFARAAARLGLPAFAIADENSVAGIVRAHAELREIGRQTAGSQDSELSEMQCTPCLLPGAQDTQIGHSVVTVPRPAAPLAVHLLRRGEYCRNNNPFSRTSGKNISKIRSTTEQESDCFDLWNRLLNRF